MFPLPLGEGVPPLGYGPSNRRVSPPPLLSPPKGLPVEGGRIGGHWWLPCRGCAESRCIRIIDNESRTLRAVSSVGQSASFTPRRSEVQVLHRPPRLQGKGELWASRPDSGGPRWRNGRRAAFRAQCPYGCVGSNPSLGTNQQPGHSWRSRACSSEDRALPCGGRGREFESRQARHFIYRIPPPRLPAVTLNSGMPSAPEYASLFPYVARPLPAHSHRRRTGQTFTNFWTRWLGGSVYAVNAALASRCTLGASPSKVLSSGQQLAVQCVEADAGNLVGDVHNLVGVNMHPHGAFEVCPL